MNKRFDETIYKTTLKNGLTIILVHKPEFRNSVALLGTNFGAKHLNQVVNGNQQQYHSGIAHFLEHKLFEKPDEDVLSVFTNMGAQANAFTSYNETVYYFSTTSDIKQPLNTLLDFVMSIDISNQGVEKEKGIIIEELRMYQELPFFRLSMELLESLFVHHPLKHDIAGTIESVTAITKEELELTYATNYHPSQLLLSVISPVDPHLILKMVKENQNRKDFSDILEVETPVIAEPETVARVSHEIDMRVNATKVALGFKQTIPFFNELDAYKTTVMTQILLDINFSRINPDYQDWVDQEIINDLFVTQGDALLQKSYTIDFLTKKKKVNEGEIPQYYVENNHEAIIDPAVFDMVQRELESRQAGKNRHSGTHIFAGKIKCGECGSWYGSKVWHSNSKYRRVIWQCNHKYNNDEKCKTPHLSEDSIKKFFIKAANKLLEDKDEIIANFEILKTTAFNTED